MGCFSSKPSQTVGDQGENIFISEYEGNSQLFGDVGQVGDGLEVHRAVRMGIDHPNDAYIELDRLIATEISLEVVDEEGKTPLHVAAENGLLVIMEQLITGLVERRCQFINTVDGRGFTALHLAVRSGSYDCCASLLNVKGINVNIKDLEGDAPIHLAVILFASEPTRERGRILDRLLDFDGIDLSLLGAHQCTPLNVMIQNSMWEYVDKILETHKDSLQYADGFGDLPIHTAARCSDEDLDIVRKLVAMSPETAMVQNTSGETAAQTASHSGNTKVAKYLGDAMLLSAAHSGMEDSVELALRYSSEKSLSCFDAYGDSPAHLAARKGHLSVIKSLIDSSAFDIEDVSCQQNDGGDTPLHLAAAGGHAAIVECLLQSSPDAYRVAVETKNSAGFAPVHLAARYGREEVIYKMIQAEYNMSLRPEVTVLTSRDSGGLTALHHAAIKSHEHLIYILLLRGSNANAKDDRGKTPLHWAASGSNQMVMRHLLECGGNPLALDNRQRTPLSIARQYDRSIFNLITECLLFRAVESGSLLGVQEAVQQIQQAGVDVAHVKDFAGLSAAHVAARGGHADILKWLIQGYVPVGEVNDVGEQCIHIACKAGKLQCVRILLNHDLNLAYDTTTDGDTPLHIASREGWVDIVKFILDECYLSTSVVNEMGNTSLHEAVCELQYDAVKALLEAGADPNERQRYGGNTPLHLVALWGSSTNSRAIVTLLLQHGASLSELNNLGETPEQVAEASGNRLVYPTSVNAPDLIDMDHGSDIESEQSFVELDEESDSMSLMTSPVQTQAPDPPLREHSNVVEAGSTKIRAVRAPTNGDIVSPFGQIALDQTTQQRILNSQGSARRKEPIQQPPIEQRPTRSSSDAEHGSLYIQPKHLTIYKNHKLGEGSFGIVFLGMLHGNRVAVKILKQENRQNSVRNNPSPEKFDQSRQAFIDELVVMSRLRHDNIQSVRGYTELDEGPAIVSAFYDRGSLVTILQKASRNRDAAKQLCWSRRIKLAKDINKGMMCMHNQDVPVIHRDLKAANCFVDDRWTAYVGDFGFTRAARDSTSQPYLAAPTNPRWLAPEILQDSTDVEFSPASDVYGFGMLLFELLTFQPPFRTQTIEMCYNLINGGNRPKIPTSLPGDERDTENFSSSGALELYINLMKACWSQRKEDRPDTNEVYSELRAIETIFKKVMLSYSVLKESLDIYSIIVLVAEIIVLIIVGITVNPSTASFVTYDATISFSYQVDSTIPYYVAILVPLFSLLLSFFILEYSLARLKSSGVTQAIGVCIIFFLDFVGAGVVTGLLTEVTKNLVGRYRPDWLSRCQPEIDNPVSISGFGLSAEDNPACTSDLSESKMNDGMKSFPSGHASTAFGLGIFVSGYCAWILVCRWGQHRKRSLIYRCGRQLVFLWILCQIGWAWGVAVSRVMDHKHHESDIIAGSFLGTCVAVAFLFKSIQQCNEYMAIFDETHASSYDADEMEISLGQNPSL